MLKDSEFLKPIFLRWARDSESDCHEPGHNLKMAWQQYFTAVGNFGKSFSHLLLQLLADFRDFQASQLF